MHIQRKMCVRCIGGGQRLQGDLPVRVAGQSNKQRQQTKRKQNGFLNCFTEFIIVTYDTKDDKQIIFEMNLMCDYLTSNSQ